MTHHERVERRITLPASRERVWIAITEAGELSAWFGADVALDPISGGRATFRWPDGTQRVAVLEEVEPPRRLSFRWLPFERTAHGATRLVPATRVELTLEAEPEGTSLTVTEGRLGHRLVREAVPG